MEHLASLAKITESWDRLPSGFGVDEYEKLLELQRKLHYCIDRERNGWVPYRYLTEIYEVVTASTVELVPFIETSEGGLHVVTFQRPEQDIHWAGQWHTPGSITMEDSFSKVLEGIMKSELVGSSIVRGPVDFGPERYMTKRGVDQAARFWAVVEDPPTDARVTSVDDVPEPFIKYQRYLLADAVESYYAHIQ